MRVTHYTFPSLLLAYTATAALTIHDSCNSRRSDIQAWIDEAAYIFDRGSQVLNEAIGEIDAGREFPGHKEILDALLGASSNRDNYVKVLGRLNAAKGFKNEDMLFRCDVPESKVDGVWDTYTARGTRSSQLVYPVEIKRIKGNPQQAETIAKRLTWRFDKDHTFLRVKIQVPDHPLAYTVNGQNDVIKADQDKLVGFADGTPTKHDWSDIVLRDILQKGLPSYKKDFHDNYDAAAKQVDFHKSEPFSITIMHEIMHSHLVGIPARHGQVDSGGKQKSANGIRRVLRLAALKQGGNNDPVENPDTYAWLAACLTMPWLKFWDQSQAPDGLDGRIRENLVDITVDRKKLANAVTVPSFLSSDKNERAKGPYCAAK